jgi:hypothetical protein
MSIEVGDARRVLLIRIEGAKHGMPRRDPVVEMAKSRETARNRTWVGADGGTGGRQEARAEEQARSPGHSTHELAPGHGHRDVRVASMTMRCPQATAPRSAVSCVETAMI